MGYKFTFTISCEKQVKKAARKNILMRKIINNKINEIILNPYHYKPLKYSLKGERRVHIKNNYVLKFTIDEQNRKVNFIFFGHHDNAY